MSESRAERARALRYKRGALASMAFEVLRVELDDIRDACDTIHWWTDQDDETLLNALDGDDEDVWEFKMAFAHLEARAYELFETIYELCRYEDDFGQVYDDCTVALIGNRYQTIGYDSFEEDYYALTGYEIGPDRIGEASHAQDQSGDHFHCRAVLWHPHRLPGPTPAV